MVVLLVHMSLGVYGLFDLLLAAVLVVVRARGVLVSLVEVLVLVRLVAQSALSDAALLALAFLTLPGGLVCRGGRG